LFDAEFVSFFARFDIDFVKSFDVFGDERNGNNQQLFFSRARELLDCFRQRR